MKISQGLAKVIDTVTEIAAFLTVFLIAFLFINDYAGFLAPSTTLNILKSIREIAIVAVVGLVGLEFAIKRGMVVFIIYAAVVAVAVVFMFFPNVLPIR